MKAAPREGPCAWPDHSACSLGRRREDDLISSDAARRRATPAKPGPTAKVPTTPRRRRDASTWRPRGQRSQCLGRPIHAPGAAPAGRGAGGGRRATWGAFLPGVTGRGGGARGPLPRGWQRRRRRIGPPVACQERRRCVRRAKAAARPRRRGRRRARRSRALRSRARRRPRGGRGAKPRARRCVTRRPAAASSRSRRPSTPAGSTRAAGSRRRARRPPRRLGAASIGEPRGPTGALEGRGVGGRSRRTTCRSSARAAAAIQSRGFRSAAPLGGTARLVAASTCRRRRLRRTGRRRSRLVLGAGSSAAATRDSASRPRVGERLTSSIRSTPRRELRRSRDRRSIGPGQRDVPGHCGRRCSSRITSR